MKKSFYLVAAVFCLLVMSVSCKKELKVSFAEKVYESEYGSELLFVDSEAWFGGLATGTYSYDKKTGELTLKYAMLLGGKTEKLTYDSSNDILTLSDGTKYHYSRECTTEELQAAKDFIAAMKESQ